MQGVGSIAPMNATATREHAMARVGSLDNLEALSLAYLALPTAIFLAAWIAAPLGIIAAMAFVVTVSLLLKRITRQAIATITPAAWMMIAVVAAGWCILGGQGHFLYANSDWWVRDAVLRDLVLDPWPVLYRYGDSDLILRTPLGYYLPAAALGKIVGLRGAELFLMLSTTIGVALTFAFMLRDRPTIHAALIRFVVFVLFSGMDILPTLARGYPHAMGEMIEWWQSFIMYGSLTTQLFWAPNHTLPGWIAAAWFVSRDPRAIPASAVVLCVTTSAFWAPLTAIGIVPLAVAAIASRAKRDGIVRVVRETLDWRLLIPVVICLGLVFPYLVAGSDTIQSGLMADIPWVGEDYGWRHLEFVLVEFAGIATLLLLRHGRDPLLWAAVALLALLPVVYFGPYNDLAMRGSVAALALLAIYAGRWLSSPWSMRDAGLRALLVVLLAIGAVTPIFEIARAVQAKPWPLNERASLIEVTQGTHYFTLIDQPWMHRFMMVTPDGATAPSDPAAKRVPAP